MTDDKLFRRISKAKQFAQKQRIEIQKQKTREIREHEFAHAAQAGKHVKEIKFYYQPDANNVDQLKFGSVSVDVSLSGNIQKDIEKLSKLINAADVVGQSQQDIKFKNHLQKKLTLLKQMGPKGPI